MTEEKKTILPSDVQQFSDLIKMSTLIEYAKLPYPRLRKRLGGKTPFTRKEQSAIVRQLKALKARLDIFV